MKERVLRIALKAFAVALALILGVGGPAACAMNDVTSGPLKAAMTLAEQDLQDNMDAIVLLISQCVDALDEGDPVRNTLQSVLVLLESGSADSASIAILLRSAIDAGASRPLETPPVAQETKPVPAETKPVPAETTAPPIPSPSPVQESPVPDESDTDDDDDSGLPAFVVSSFIKTVMKERVLVDVPRDWGNNASGRALTSYSPVNGSGAISPAAGTLTISSFPSEGDSEQAAFDAYTRSIASMSVTTWLEYEDARAANLPARRIRYTMSVGANQFSCETVCFVYEDTVYAIELMQGGQTTYNYFPVYRQVVRSAEVASAEQVAMVLANQQEETPPPAAPVTPTPRPEAGPGQAVSFPGDIGSFRYAINGRVYQFPTRIRDMEEGDLPLDRDVKIPYDFSSDADMTNGRWTEIVNTQYFSFDSSSHKEIAAVTNLSGYTVFLRDCVLTALIDTAGACVDVTLPGDVRVGEPESSILRGFPEFAGLAMDGIAGFRGNELIYACNVRDDGCNGYVVIRNDFPYYSAVSIICDGGVICEISFECLGSVRAEGVFLD